MNEPKPFEISGKALKKLVMKVYKNSDTLPKFFPTVEEIDSLIESKLFDERQIKEDVFKYFVACLVYGFSRDRAWHEENPGYDEPTPENIIQYISTPLEGERSIEPHVMIWQEDTVLREKEDVQSAFEYLQWVLFDQKLYLISEK